MTSIFLINLLSDYIFSNEWHIIYRIDAAASASPLRAGHIALYIICIASSVTIYLLGEIFKNVKTISGWHNV